MKPFNQNGECPQSAPQPQLLISHGPPPRLRPLTVNRARRLSRRVCLRCGRPYLPAAPRRGGPTRRGLFPALASLKPNPFGVTRAAPSEEPVGVPRDLFFPLLSAAAARRRGDASCPVFKVKDILLGGFTGRHSRDCCVCLRCCHFV